MKLFGYCCFTYFLCFSIVSAMDFHCEGRCVQVAVNSDILEVHGDVQLGINNGILKVYGDPEDKAKNAELQRAITNLSRHLNKHVATIEAQKNRILNEQEKLYEANKHLKIVLKQFDQWAAQNESTGQGVALEKNIQQARRNFDIPSLKALLLEKQKVQDRMKADTAFQLAELYELEFLYHEAEKQYNKANQLDPENEMYLSKAGALASKMGKYPEAIKLLQRSLEFKTVKYGLLNGEVIAEMVNLGAALQGNSDYANAWNVYRTALDLAEQINKDSQVSTNISRIVNNLGVIHYNNSEFDVAKQYYEQALNQNLELYGALSLESSLSYTNLGTVSHSLAALDEAIAYYERSLEINRRILGESNDRVAQDYHNIGNSFLALGKFEQAKEYLNKALTIDIQLFGENHPKIALRYLGIGTLYQGLNQPYKVITYYEKALGIDLNAFGPSHPNVSRDWHLLGVAWGGVADYRKAKAFFQKSLKADLALFSEQHTRVAFNRYYLGNILFKEGSHSEALEHVSLALETMASILGEAHPSTKEIRKNYSSMLAEASLPAK